MKFTAGLRMLGLLRRIAVALEGLREQLIYRNEREFPPIRPTSGERKKLVISRRPRVDEDATG